MPARSIVALLTLVVRSRQFAISNCRRSYNGLVVHQGLNGFNRFFDAGHRFIGEASNWLRLQLD